ncbi:MAG: glycosyltransferase [Anaerolineaceae bacterium]|nr:glycosyltransferase [Anaerolineaceae bacterium]
MSIPNLRLGIQQRVLPLYRTGFFELLANSCGNGLSLFCGQARSIEAVQESSSLKNAELIRGRNLHLFSGSFYFCFQYGLLDWLKTWQPEILLMEANPRYLSTPSAIRWMQRQKRPIIGWGLGAPEVHQKGFLAAMLQNSRHHLMQQFDAVICYSQQGADEYKILGIPEDRIFIAPNAVSPKPVHPLPRRPDNFQNDQPNLLYIGRLQERKRLDMLIRACAGLPHNIQPRLQIIGDGPARETLVNLAKDIYPKTEFPGAIHGIELESWFLKADLFVLPGTGGLAVQQAMSFGLPVIVAEADGTQSDLVRPQNGWQIPPGGMNALQNSILEALSDISSLRKRGIESFRIVNEEINLENMVQVFENTIQFVQEKK